MLPQHGKLTCRRCFTGDEALISPHPKWKMSNDVGSWGGQYPKYLILGFSKGFTQSRVLENGRFEDVAFAGMRNRLTDALRVVGVIDTNTTVDELVANPEGDYTFGSLIRCGVSRIDEKALKVGRELYSCTGPLINKSFSEIPDVIDACFEQYLMSIPNRTDAVLLLGNGDSYVKSCQKLIAKHFLDFEKINPMVSKANGRYWIHLAHPSGLNGHFNTWLKADHGSGLKRMQAADGVSLSRER